MGGGGLQFLAPLVDAAGSNPFSSLWFLFIHGGFIAFFPLLVRMLWYSFNMWIQTMNGEKFKFVLLGINVPPLNEQSMVAIEQVFAHLSGPHQNYTWLEIHWDGALQYVWSVELASIDGYVQFMIRTNVKMRDVVEAAIYAQYPDAEIFEVEDYTKNAPTVYPNPDYEMWGVELVKTTDHVYPIRTYRSFEHPLTGIYADPMAAMLEIFGSLGPGEQLWFQIVMTPVDHHWPKRAEKIIAKMVGAKVKYKPTVVDQITDIPIGAISILNTSVFGSEENAAVKKKDDGPPNQMLYLTPGQRLMLEAVQTKITKIAFFSKLRFIYVARKEVARRRTIISSMFGAIKQFNTLDMNGFKPGKRTKTTAEWFFADQRKNWRKTKIMRAFRDRDNWAGEGEGVLLNIEELATLWHFPILTVKAPAVGKAQARKGEPPTELPVEKVILPSGEVAYRAGSGVRAGGDQAITPAENAAAKGMAAGAARVTRQHAPMLPKNFKGRPATKPGFVAPKNPAVTPVQPTARPAVTGMGKSTSLVYDPTFSAQAHLRDGRDDKPTMATVSKVPIAPAPPVEQVADEEGPGTPPPNLPFV